MERIALGRWGSAEEMAAGFVFLASDETRHFHGQCLSPNGGDVML